MDDTTFLMCYPAFVIGHASQGGSPEQVAVRMIDGRHALPVFTETIFAERFMDAEHIPGGIFVVPSPAILLNLIRRYRDSLELVIVDPNPETGRATQFDVDVFMRGLETASP